MPNIPTVSVVVAAFNASKTIETLIDSILEQTVQSFEILICDDASEDATIAVIGKYKDSRIHLLRNSRNLGPGATRDRAIDAASGIWIALADADDAWKPTRLETLLKASAGDEGVIIFDNLMICHHSDRRLIPWKTVHRTKAFNASHGAATDVPFTDYVRSERLLIKGLIPRAALLRSGVRHSERRFGEDAEFYIRLGIAGLRFRYVPKALYLYRATPGSATAQAAGHNLMRECLEACSTISGISREVSAAIDMKISTLKQRETLYELSAAVTALRFKEIARILTRNPELLSDAYRIGIQRMHYIIHRTLHGGKGR